MEKGEGKEERGGREGEREREKEREDVKERFAHLKQILDHILIHSTVFLNCRTS